jgi:subtilisin family serine protease
MATPHVSGVAALLWSANPEWTNLQIGEAMAATALDLGEPGRDIAYGFGLVQAYDALMYLQQLGQ